MTGASEGVLNGHTVAIHSCFFLTAGEKRVGDIYKMNEIRGVLYCRMTLFYFDVAYEETEEFRNCSNRRMNRNVKNSPSSRG